MVHVCYGIYDKNGHYSKFTGTSMLSIFENTNSKVTIHILHDNTLTQNNREKFQIIADKYNQTVEFHNIEQTFAKEIAEFKRIMPTIINSRVSVGALYRFFIANIFQDDLEKVVYLDSDVIINLDIDELHKIEIGDNTLAGVPEILNSDSLFMKKAFYICEKNFVNVNDYFNSGVLIFNLKVLRNSSEIIRNGFIFITTKTPCQHFDQDILNYCFADKYLKLPIKFNTFIIQSRQRGEANISAKIYHYAGDALNLNLDDSFNDLWFEYFAKTPWFNADVIGRLYEGFKQINIEQKNFAVQVSAIVSGKQRAFFIPPNNIDAVKSIFLVNPNEELILADSQQSIQKLIDSLNQSRGQKIFFILANYSAVAQILRQLGFIEDKDFLNAAMFLSDAHGVSLNTYSIIKSL